MPLTFQQDKGILLNVLIIFKHIILIIGLPCIIIMLIKPLLLMFQITLFFMYSKPESKTSLLKILLNDKNKDYFPPF